MVLDRTVRLERMTWVEAKESISESNGVVIIPIGAIEEHGPHLPLGTDSIETFEVGYRAANEVKVVVAPPIWYGNSRSFMDFPGTVTIQPETLKAFVKDVALSLIQHGFDKIVILDGHGGNYGILDLLAEEIHLEKDVLACHILAWDMATLPKPDTIPYYDGHGGYNETSIMMYLCPDDVDKSKFIDSKPEVELSKFGAGFPGIGSYYSKGAAKIALSLGEWVEHGHHGDPSYADRERGRDLIGVKTDALVDFLLALKNNKIKYRKSQVDK